MTDDFDYDEYMEQLVKRLERFAEGRASSYESPGLPATRPIKMPDPGALAHSTVPKCGGGIQHWGGLCACFFAVDRSPAPIDQIDRIQRAYDAGYMSADQAKEALEWAGRAERAMSELGRTVKFTPGHTVGTATRMVGQWKDRLLVTDADPPLPGFLSVDDATRYVEARFEAGKAFAFGPALDYCPRCYTGDYDMAHTRGPGCKS